MDMDNDMDNKAFQAALVAFEQSHPAAAAWVRWVQATFQDNSARLAEVEAMQAQARATQQRTDAKLALVGDLLRYRDELLTDYKALLADHDALVERYADLQLLYAARVAVDEAEEGD